MGESVEIHISCLTSDIRDTISLDVSGELLWLTKVLVVFRTISDNCMDLTDTVEFSPKNYRRYYC